MGLYDDRLADLSESRQNRRVARRRPASESRSSTSVQSLLFGRNAGWTTAKAKAWAKAHGYRYGEVDVTDQYIRVRQSDPRGFKVKRTIPFGKGIRAVVAREESPSMAKVVAARRKTRRRSKKAAPKRARRRRRVKAAVVAAPRRRRRKKVAKVARRRRRRVHAVAAKRTRRRRRVRAWRGNSAGHATAARKGWRKRKSSKAPVRRRRRRKMREATVVAAPRRRRRRHAHRKMRETVVTASRRSHRRHGRRSRRMRSMVRASRGGGMGMAELGLAVVTGGFGFILADGLDRFLATYNPSGTTRPTNKFTSDGAGTLANTLNVAARPSWARAGAAVGAVALPAFGASMVRSSYARAALEGATVGAGVSAFKMIWNTLIMPLLTPKDVSTPSLQKCVIARLYPAEVAAHINLQQKQVSPGVLSGPDVGPFALAGDSSYPDAAQALRRQAGVQEQFPTLQNTWGTGGPGSDYPTAAQALRAAAGLSDAWQPGPPADVGPGPQAQPHKDCGCIGQANPFLGFVDGAPSDEGVESPLFSQ